MKPPAVGYRRATSVDHALDLLAELGDDAKLLAGGQSLVPMLNLRLARPSVLVDIARVDTGAVARAGDRVRLGATTRHRELEFADVREHVPLFAECAPHIGFPAVRNRGTLGGSLSHADSHAELAVAAVTLDAEMVLRSRDRGERRVPASSFFVGPFMTVVEPDEMLTEVVVPATDADGGVHFEEITERTGDFATAALAATWTLRDGRLGAVRLGAAGLMSVPVRLHTLERLLDGATTLPDVAALGDAVTEDAEVLGVEASERRFEISLVCALARGFAESLLDKEGVRR